MQPDTANYMLTEVRDFILKTLKPIILKTLIIINLDFEKSTQYGSDFYGGKCRPYPEGKNLVMTEGKGIRKRVKIRKKNK